MKRKERTESLKMSWCSCDLYLPLAYHIQDKAKIIDRERGEKANRTISWGKKKLSEEKHVERLTSLLGVFTEE